MPTFQPIGRIIAKTACLKACCYACTNPQPSYEQRSKKERSYAFVDKTTTVKSYDELRVANCVAK
jgi:hypothetical protein